MNSNSGQAKFGYDAFTIVELLVVIVVIGILAAITIVSYSGISNKATVAAIQSDLSNIREQIELYKVDNSDGIPSSISKGCASSGDILCVKTSGSGQISSVINSSLKKYCVSVKNNNQSFFFTESSAIAEGGCAKLDDGTHGASNTVKGYYEGKLTNLDTIGFSYDTGTSTYAGNHNTIITRSGYKTSVPSLLTHVTVNSYGFKVGTSGVNDLVMSPNVSATRQVMAIVTGSYLTSSMAITSFQLKFSDGTTKSLSQSVADGYIEPLVLINSSLPWATSCYWSNILNIYTNTATSTMSFATANIIFTLKDYALTDILTGLNVATNAKDGFLVQSVGREFGVSLK